MSHKAQLIAFVQERARWACHDCWTYVFAKTQAEWGTYTHTLGGGNMAKPLILFPLWDFLSAVNASTISTDRGLVWTEKDATLLEPAVTQLNALRDQLAKNEKKVSKLRLTAPKLGQIVDDQ